MTKSIKYCCNKFEAYEPRTTVLTDGEVDLCDYSGEESWFDIKFCPFCGKEIIIMETIDEK